MTEQPQKPVVEGGRVFWRQERFNPEDLEAELPDGTRVKADSAIRLAGGIRVSA